MADGAFTTAAADRAKDQIFPASIIKIELRENGGASDQFAEMGDSSEGEFTAEPAFQAVHARQQRQFGYNLNFTGSLVCTGANMRAAINAALSYVVDLRFTDITGDTFTLASEDTGIKFDMTVCEEITGSNEVDGARRFMLTGSGFATGTKWAALFAAAA